MAIMMRSNRLSYISISSMLTTRLFEIRNHKILQFVKVKDEFVDSQFANRDSGRIAQL